MKKYFKYSATALVCFCATEASAQTFIAGYDFDGLALNAQTATANFGIQSGSAALSWTHDPQGGPPTFTAPDFFLISTANSLVINDAFTFADNNVDPITGFTNFSDNTTSRELGFRSLSATDTFTFTFDGSGFTDLELIYAFDADGINGAGGFALETLDLSSQNDTAAATFALTTADEALYDNFAIVGTPIVVPEPSAFAALLGLASVAFVGLRRRCY